MTRLLCLLILLLATAQISHAQDEKKEPKPDSTKKEKKKNKDLPLEAARKIKIQSNEGSWISLDVSPDGKTIAFVNSANPDDLAKLKDPQKEGMPSPAPQPKAASISENQSPSASRFSAKNDARKPRSVNSVCCIIR